MPIQYSIDTEDRICAIAGPWASFARDNNALDLAESSKVIGQPLWVFLAGPEIKSFYQQIFNQVRVSGIERCVPFRCDSPTLEREMQLTVSLQANGELLVTSELCHEARTEYSPYLDSQIPRLQQFINVCSLCRRCSLGNNVWIAHNSEELFRRDFVSLPVPKLKECVCGDCADEFSDLKYFVSYSGGHDIDRFSEPVPLLVCVHGSQQQSHSLRLQASPELVFNGKLADAPPFYLLSVFKQTGEAWDSQEVLDAIYTCQSMLPIDQQRIYVTGFSSGGMVVWRLINDHPELFTAALPISTIPFALRKLDLPIWAVHGEKDALFPINWFINRMNIVSKFTKTNANLKWTCLPECGHDAWTSVYQNTSTWNWLFKHAKKSWNVNVRQNLSDLG